MKIYGSPISNDCIHGKKGYPFSKIIVLDNIGTHLRLMCKLPFKKDV